MSNINSRKRSEVGRIARDDGATSARPLSRPPTTRTRRSALARRATRAAAGLFPVRFAGRSAAGFAARLAVAASGRTSAGRSPSRAPDRGGPPSGRRSVRSRGGPVRGARGAKLRPSPPSRGGLGRADPSPSKRRGGRAPSGRRSARSPSGRSDRRSRGGPVRGARGAKLRPSPPSRGGLGRADPSPSKRRGGRAPSGRRSARSPSGRSDRRSRGGPVRGARGAKLRPSPPSRGGLARDELSPSKRRGGRAPRDDVLRARLRAGSTDPREGDLCGARAARNSAPHARRPRAGTRFEPLAGQTRLRALAPCAAACRPRRARGFLPPADDRFPSGPARCARPPLCVPCDPVSRHAPRACATPPAGGAGGVGRDLRPDR